ncbi:MAG: hypothetical protein ABIQ81_00190 [Novosphingobium sp.]
MSFWSAMVAIVAIIAFTAARMARYRAGLGDPPRRASILGATAEAISASTSPRETELQREVEDLRQRIAVLERIATEDRHGKAIAAEIESLRST